MKKIHNNLFDEWAKAYEQDIKKSQGQFPFAGYFDIIEFIRKEIVAQQYTSILDIGVGTGYMLDKICAGLIPHYYGIDFSEKMLNIASEKLDKNNLLHWDISNKNIPPAIKDEKFDLNISAYTLHHFDTQGKIEIIENYKKLLSKSGRIIIADISFDTVSELEKNKIKAAEKWDDSEEKGYFIAPEFIEKAASHHWTIDYSKFSFCSAIYSIF